MNREERRARAMANRHCGASISAREFMETAKQEANWRAFCPVCRKNLKGTFTQLTEHECGPPSQ